MQVRALSGSPDSIMLIEITNNKDTRYIMTEEIAVQNTANAIIANSNLPSEDLEFLGGTGKRFTPRLQLMTDRSKKCIKKEFPVNHFALIQGKEHTDMGETVDMLVISVRPKALKITDDEVISCFDPKLELCADGKTKRPTGMYAEIADLADNTKDSGCMHGLEFLVWLPKMNDYVTFYFGSKTMRNETKTMMSYMNRACTAYAKMIETKKYTYYSASIKGCTVPFAPPPEAEINDQIEKFKNPPASTREEATEEEAASQDRPQ